MAAVAFLCRPCWYFPGTWHNPFNCTAFAPLLVLLLVPQLLLEPLKVERYKEKYERELAGWQSGSGDVFTLLRTRLRGFPVAAHSWLAAAAGGAGDGRVRGAAQVAAVVALALPPEELQGTGSGGAGPVAVVPADASQQAIGAGGTSTLQQPGSGRTISSVLAAHIGALVALDKGEGLDAAAIAAELKACKVAFKQVMSANMCSGLGQAAVP